MYKDAVLVRLSTYLKMLEDCNVLEILPIMHKRLHPFFLL